ncbi:hypothetical protein HY345_01395 [Candidatus Microgenomates bacterium]|nr:hypothetical protein [Candidatus Microgenomates bacterium]
MKLVLIDGNAILHRAFHAIPSLTTTKGQLVNAVYGFISMLLRVKDDLQPDYLAVCFDRPKPTFRQEIFIGYQAHRPRMDEDLSSQIETVHDVVRRMKVPIYEMDGYEADDLLGTIAKESQNSQVGSDKAGGKSKNLKIFIVTGDRDILQLVNKNVKVYMPTKGLSEAKVFGEKEVEEKLGVKPGQVVDYKGLVGDPSDGYVGVTGIGPKTASSLLQKYKTLQKVYENLDKLPEQVAQKLKEGEESARLSYQLATIKKDVPCDFSLKNAKISQFNNPEVQEKLEELEFHSLLNRITGKKTGVKKKEKKNKENENQLGLF